MMPINAKMRILAVLIFLICFTGCAPGAVRGRAAPLEAGYSNAGETGETRTALQRKMTYSASLSLEVDSFQGLEERTRGIVEGKGGFVVTSSDSEKRYSAEMKVPPDQLSEVIELLSELGEVQSKSIHAEDVTERIADLEGKLKNLLALRDRYRLVLDRAKEMKDVLAVEQELNRIQGEIESLEGQLHGVQKRVQWSNLSFSARRSTIYGPLGYLGHGALWVLEKLFVIR